jgi:hypothetical protein
MAAGCLHYAANRVIMDKQRCFVDASVGTQLLPLYRSCVRSSLPDSTQKGVVTLSQNGTMNEVRGRLVAFAIERLRDGADRTRPRYKPW